MTAMESTAATAEERLPLEPRRSVAATGCVFAGRCPKRIGAICDEQPPPTLTPTATHRLTCHLALDALEAR